MSKLKILSSSIFYFLSSLCLEVQCAEDKGSSDKSKVPSYRDFLKSYTDDLSDSYKTSGKPTSEDFNKMENKFKADSLKKGRKGRYWTQEMVDLWEISQEARDEINIKATKPIQAYEKKEFFTRLNDNIKSLKLRKPERTNVSNLSG